MSNTEVSRLTEDTGNETNNAEGDLIEGEVQKAPPDKKLFRKLVQMKFSQHTLDRIENMRNITGITNRTHLVASAIQIASLIMTEVFRGGKITIERKDGTKSELTVVGLPN